jgi:hypothetical protein
VAALADMLLLARQHDGKLQHQRPLRWQLCNKTAEQSQQFLTYGDCNQFC